MRADEQQATPLRVAYVSHYFPTVIEPYVWREIDALRRAGADVFPFAVTRPPDLEPTSHLRGHERACTYLRPLRPGLLLRALVTSIAQARQLRDIYARVLWSGREGPLRRLRALVHVWMGAYFALLLKPARVAHIHAHHGYFAAWAAMVASRLLGVPFSMTLHGSDLLVDRIYLDLKVRHSKFVVTISEYNRRFLMQVVPDADPGKIVLSRLGVEISRSSRAAGRRSTPVLLTVGRLRGVKNHAFLIDACGRLREAGVDFLCLIVGDGPARRALERRIRRMGLSREVKLLGALQRRHVDVFYEIADVFVLTSRSEGIPIVLMEAMMHGKPVLAPDITGIPELVVDGKTGFLYRPDDLGDFVARLQAMLDDPAALGPITTQALTHLRASYDRETNLRRFVEMFLDRVRENHPTRHDEDPLLQQIPLRVQRH
jgi:glycosyltransferase involved in cell wall biosynthesis